MSGAAAEAERRRRARARKAQTAPPVAAPRLYGPELELLPDGTQLDDCPDPAHHKYECLACGHYDLDDYE